MKKKDPLPKVSLQADRVSKYFYPALHPVRHLLHRLCPRFFTAEEARFVALQDVSFQLHPGEVLGLVGVNGAGKSTLLQIIAGIYQPDEGELISQGRIAALLELGAGFNPELTGRENIYLYSALLGWDEALIRPQEQAIVAFSELEAFIDQPVKTYSSGMIVRLAFSIATALQPDVLIIDEALSVGDGAFARKSFKRILHLKEQGAAIILCSHLLHQIDALADQVLWLEKGKVRQLGDPGEVLAAYQAFLDQKEHIKQESAESSPKLLQETNSSARLKEVKVYVDGVRCNAHDIKCVCEQTDLSLKISYRFSVEESPPSLAIVFYDENIRPISSCSTYLDAAPLPHNEQGEGEIEVNFPRLPLLKGRYTLGIYLMCEQAVLILDAQEHCIQLNVTQSHHAVGVVMLPRVWRGVN